jgi:hypothetical protein
MVSSIQGLNVYVAVNLNEVRVLFTEAVLGVY